MTALVGAYTFPSVVAFVHRFSRRALVRSVLLLSVLSGVVMLVFREREVFDEMHQKRLFVIHMENVSILCFIGSLTANPPGFSDSLDHNKRKPLARRKRGRRTRL